MLHLIVFFEKFDYNITYMKNKSENILKRWYKLAQPHKGYWFWQIFFYCCFAIFLTVLTIFAARTINCMYAGDWTGAFINLAIELATIVLRNVFQHCQYYFYGKQIRYIENVINKKVYKKIISCDTSSLKKISKEKLLNITLNNRDNIREFPDVVSSFIAYSLQVIITLVTVFISNYLAGIIVLCLGVVNFFAYYFFNKKLGKIMLERCEKKDEMFKSYSKVLEGKEIIKELGGESEYESEILDKTKDFSKSYTKYYMVSSWKTNIYFAIWNVIVYAITALMLYFVSKGTLEIAIYLIIVPYLSTCTEKLNTLFDKTGSIENLRVDVDRMNIILNMSDKELVKFGKFNEKTEGYNLGFIDVSFANTDKHSDFVGKLTGADISFKMNGINVIKGEKGSGKRVVFNLLRRYIKPDKGMVLLDNLDLYEYNEKTFKNHINYCSSHPTFLKGSIRENLLLSEKDFEKVKDMCEQVGVIEQIEALPGGFDCPISEIKSSGTLFLIGLARAALSNCKILMIYEIPEDMPNSFHSKVKNLIVENDLHKTIILFTHSDDYDDIAQLTYEVKAGKVKMLKAKKTK